MASINKEEKPAVIGYLRIIDFELFKKEYTQIISDFTRADRNMKIRTIKLKICLLSSLS